MKSICEAAIVVGLATFATTALSQNVDHAPTATITYRDLRALTPPVTPHDISDRRYRVLGRIETTVKKSIAFEGAADDAKAYKELWERAVKLGTDAVVHAQVGKPQHPAFGAWGAREATGEAIRFLD
jgi:hypothetical protein